MLKALRLIPLCLAAMQAHSEDASIALGKERAARSTLQWEVRDAAHPVLGPIRFAFLKTPVTTPVRTARLASNVYFSCEKTRRRIAIELANATAPDDPTGLKPAVVPRLTCHRPSGNRVLQEELNASWEFNALGDALSRGLAPFPLRECATISVHQEVLLPEDWGIRSAKVELEFSPYARALDEIFVACGELSAYKAATPEPVASRAAAAALKLARNSDMPWKPARAVASGKTVVRSKPNAASPAVAELHPGEAVMIQHTGREWVRVKPRSGSAFEGYVRRDRLVFK